MRTAGLDLADLILVEKRSEVGMRFRVETEKETKAVVDAGLKHDVLYALATLCYIHKETQKSQGIMAKKAYSVLSSNPVWGR